MKRTVLLLFLLIGSAHAKDANEWEVYLKSKDIITSCENLAQGMAYEKKCQLTNGIIFLDSSRATLAVYKGNIEKQCIDFLALEIKDIQKIEDHVAVAKRVAIMTGSPDFMVEYNYGGRKNASIGYSELFGSTFACTIINENSR